MSVSLFLLQIIFIVLKVAGVIGWSWGLILLPLWISLGLGAFALLLFGTVAIGVAKGLNL